jgi:hypothetical protein
VVGARGGVGPIANLDLFGRESRTAADHHFAIS